MPRKKNTEVEAATAVTATIDPDQVDLFPGHDVQMIDIADIDRQNNHRHLATVDADKIRELAESIKSAGLMQPIRVYRRAEADQADGKPVYVLGYGHRRTAAVELLGRTQIMAQVCQAAPAWVIQQARAMENLARQDLNTLEEMTAVVQLVAACEGDIDVAAGKLGRGRKWVQDRMYMDRLSHGLREQVAAGEINLAHARELAKLVDYRAQEDVVRMWSHRNLHRGTPDHVFRDDVAKQMRSLRGTPWELDQPFADKPACSGCSHNSANDLELFEREASEKRSPSCASALCYGHKMVEAEKQMAKAIKSCAGDVVEGKLSLTIARTKAPQGLRPEMLQSEVRRTASPALHAAGGGSASKAAKKETPEQAARRKYDTAVSSWEQSEDDKIEAAMSKGVHLGTLRLLVASENYLGNDYQIRNAKPKEKAVSDMLFHAALKGDLVLLAKNLATSHGMYEIEESIHSLADEHRQIFLKSIGVTPAIKPQLEDFLPKPTPESPTPRKTARKGKMAAAGAHLDDDAEGGEA